MIDEKLDLFIEIKYTWQDKICCITWGSNFRFVFLIPAESGEKITLGISTMLNMTVFLMTVMSGLPATDQTPILSKEQDILKKKLTYLFPLGMYYATVMVLTTAATVTGVLILRIHHQGRRGIPVPQYLRTTAQ